MNGPFQVAQANIAGQTPGKPPARIVKIGKPFSDQSVVVALSYDGSVKADLSAIAGEKITLVHIGEKLIILFDNKSTVTLEPFFDSTGKPLDSLTVEVSPGRNLTGAEFAALFPVTEDQSVLPAAGDGNGNAQASGANFSSVGVDPLASPGPLDLLGQEELPNFVIANLLTPAVTDADLIPSQITGTRVGGVTEEEQLGGMIAEREGSSQNIQFNAIWSGGKEDPNDVTLPNSNGTASDGLDQDTPEDSFVTTQFFHGAGANALTNLVASGNPPLTFTIDAGIPNSAVVDGTGAVVKSAGNELRYSAIDTSVAGDNTIVGGYSDGESGFREVFRLTIHSDGTYDFELLDKIDHPVHTTDTGSTSNGHLEETLFLDFTALVHVADLDGDNFTLTGSGAFTIGVIDDTPEVSVSAADTMPLSFASLDESIGSDLGDSNAATDDVAGNTVPDPLGVKAIGEVKSDTGTLANLFSVTGTTGEDGFGSVDYAFSLTLAGVGQNGGVATTLSVTDPNHVYGNDSTIYLFNQGGAIVGRVGGADGAIALRISIENPGNPATAHFVVDQYLPVDHGQDGNDFDSSLPLTLVGDGTLGVTLTTTVTDGDGDVASSAATVTIIDNETSPISIEDDGPTITAGEGGETTPLAVLNLDETIGADRYNTGESESGVPNGADDKAAAVTVSIPPLQAIGELSTGTGALAGLFTAAAVDFGTDGPAAGGGITHELSLVLSSETVGTNLTATALVGTPLGGMMSNQRAIELVQVNATTIEGRLVGDGIAANGDEYVAFRITLENPNDPATAKITVDQFLAIDHGGSENPSVFDEQTLLTLIGNGALDLKLVTAVTDGDGDRASLEDQVNLIGNKNSFIAFGDDGPKPLSISAANGAANGLFFDGFVPNNDAWGAGSGINNSGTAGAWHIAASPYEGASTIQLERVGDNYRGSDSPTNSVMVDLEATPGNVQVSQDLTLTPGAVYHLTFEIGAANDPGIANSAKLEVFWNGTSVGTYTPTSGVMQTISIDVTAAGANNQLTFREIGEAGDNTGTFLANVKLSDVIIIDETKGVDADSDDTTGLGSLFATVTNSGPVGVDPDMDQPQYAQGLHSVVVLGAADYGTDGAAATNPIQIGLSVSSAGVDSGLTTTEGKAIHLYVEGALVVGRFDSGNNGSYDTAAFALSIDPNGGILSIAQYVSLYHPDINSSDEGVYLKPGTVLATVTVTDGDGDRATTSADISSAVRFEDDGPVAIATARVTATVDEDGLQGGNLDGNPLRAGETDGSESATFTGNAGALNTLVNFGADGPGSFGLSVQNPTVISGLFSKSQQVSIVSDGTTLTGYVESGNGSGFSVGDREIFTLTVGSDGSYVFTLKDQVDHPAQNGENGDNSENLLSGNGIDLSSFVVATDGDNDSVSLAAGTFTIQVLDDIPVLTARPANETSTTVTEALVFDLKGGNDVVGGVSSSSIKGIWATGEDLNDNDDTANTSNNSIGIGDGQAIDGLGKQGQNATGPEILTLQFFENVNIQNGNGVPTHGAAYDVNTFRFSVNAAEAQQNDDAVVFVSVFNNGAVVSPDNYAVTIDGGSPASAGAIVHNVYSGGNLIGFVFENVPDDADFQITSDTGFVFDAVKIGNYNGYAFTTDNNVTATVNTGNSFKVYGLEADIVTTVVTPETFKVSHDESAGVNAAADPNPADDVSDAGAPAVISGAFGYAKSAISVLAPGSLFAGKVGADEDGTYSFSITDANGQPIQNAPSGVKALVNGQAVDVVLNTDLATGAVVGTAGAIMVFKLYVDTDGFVWMAQYAPIAHDVDGSSAASFDDIVRVTADLHVKASLTDFDGDTTAMVSPVALQIEFQDDGPTAVAGDAMTVAETDGSTAGVNLLANDTKGADDATVTHVNFGIDFVAITAGTDLGSGVYQFTNTNGTYTFKADGTWTFDPVVNTSNSDTTGNFTYRITDGDGDTSEATQTVNIKNTNSLPTAGAVTASVDDEGLTGGIVGDGQSSGDVALPSPERIATGTLTHAYNGDGKAASDPINFAPMDGATGMVGTESVTYRWTSGTNTLVATSNAGRGDIFKVVVDGGSDASGAGNYTLTLLKPIMHALGDNENNASAVLTYQVKDGSSPADTANGTLTVTFNDDTPVAVSESASVSEGQKPTMNVVFVIDTSGSMGSGVGSGMELAKAAAITLLNNSSVDFNQIMVVNFASTASNNTPIWADKADAIAYISGLSADHETDYDAALAKVTSNWGSGPTPADQTVVYFISDGEPNQDNGTGSVGIVGAEKTAWEVFLASKGVAASYAVGISTGVNDADLTPIAWAPGNPDLPPMTITSAGDLSSTITSSLPGSVSGNILSNGDGFGADGGYVKSITVNGTTYTFDGNATITTSNAPGAGDVINANGKQITITTDLGGKLVFNFAANGANQAGEWDYTAPTNIAATSAETFAYTLVDGDGDTVGASLNLTVNNINAAPSGTNNTLTVLEDQSLTLTAAHFGFSDAGDTPASALQAVKITTLETAGSLKLNGVDVTLGQVISAADINAGLLTFTGAQNANGAAYASFTFQVQDNGGTANGGIDLDPTPNTMTINVTAVNDTPTANIANASYNATEQTNLTLATNGVSLGSIGDIDAGNNEISATLSVTQGILTVTAGNSSVSSISGNGTSVVTITGTVTEINRLLGGIDNGGGSPGTIVYQADLDNPAATTTLTLTANDTGDTGSGGALTAVDTATINVAAVNDSPNANSDSIIVNVAASDASVLVMPELVLLLNDSDPENSPLDVTVTSSLSGLASVSLVTNPGSLTITNNTQSGSGNDGDWGSFTYTLTAGGQTDTATASISIDTSGALDGNGNNNILFDAKSNVGSTLNGNGGDDILFGGGGNDTLNGGADDDVLVGGIGNDILDGGTGLDRFFYSETGTTNQDTINNYNGTGTSKDVIDLSALLDATFGPSSNIDNFIKVTDTGANAVVQIDATGTGNFTSAGNVATLTGYGTVGNIVSVYLEGAEHQVQVTA